MPQEFKINPRLWAREGQTYYGSPEVVQTLPGAFFRPLRLPFAYALVQAEIKTDELLPLPTPEGEALLAEFNNFWDKAEAVAARGFVVKRGLLMSGPPGSGKTVLVQRMAQRMIEERGGIAIMYDNVHDLLGSMRVLRQLEKDRPAVIIHEDFEALLEDGDEHTTLALLDGEYQFGNVFHVATTNYPERLAARWINRPGRFDRVIEVGMPLAAARRAYFKAKAPKADDAKIDYWVNNSNGWSIAHMREFIIAHDVMGEADTEVFARFNAMRKREWFKGAEDDNEAIAAE